MANEEVKRKFWGPLYDLMFCYLIITLCVVIYVTSKSIVLSILPYLGFAGAILQDFFMFKFKLKINEGADIVATNNSIASLLGHILSLSLWMLGTGKLILVLFDRTTSNFVLLYGFTFLWIIIGAHVISCVYYTKRLIWIIRSADESYFIGKMRFRLIYEALIFFGFLGPVFWTIRHILRKKIRGFDI